MKQIIILILTFIPFIYSCEKGELSSSDLNQIREIAWNSLDEKSQLTIIIEWKEAVVEETTYEKENVYSVRFNTTDDALLGPIVIYISKSNLSVVGKIARF